MVIRGTIILLLSVTSIVIFLAPASARSADKKDFSTAADVAGDSVGKGPLIFAYTYAYTYTPEFRIYVYSVQYRGFLAYTCTYIYMYSVKRKI